MRKIPRYNTCSSVPFSADILEKMKQFNVIHTAEGGDTFIFEVIDLVRNLKLLETESKFA